MLYEAPIRNFDDIRAFQSVVQTSDGWFFLCGLNAVVVAYLC